MKPRRHITCDWHSNLERSPKNKVVKLIYNSWRENKTKSLPWRRFGYVILITIKVGELFLWISPRNIKGLRSYIKHEEKYFIRIQIPKSWGTWLCLVFSNHLSTFGYPDEALFLVFDILLVISFVFWVDWFVWFTMDL